MNVHQLVAQMRNRLERIHRVHFKERALADVFFDLRPAHGERGSV